MLLAFKHKGCFVDDPLRALPDVLGIWPKVQPSVALANCFAAAKAKSVNVFGIQYDGECYSRYLVLKQILCEWETYNTDLQHVHGKACCNIGIAFYCFRVSHPITTYSYS
jgi:hypothetical protein